MITFTDTHTHLYLDEFAPDNESAVKRAIDAGVNRMIFPNVDLGTIEPMERLAKSFPKNTFVAMGLHPTEISDKTDCDLSQIINLILNHTEKYVAIGEIGMDLYWDKTFERQQMASFDKQLSIAQQLNSPVIIHCREALDQTLEVMQAYHTLRGVFHSFGGSVSDVERIRRDHDFFFGINGIVTFKNSKLSDTLQAIGLDRLLLETDSPYLAPVPHRGHRNESAYLIHTAQYVADHLGVDIDTLSAQTNNNADSLFNLLN